MRPFTAAWIAILVNGLAVLVFGLVITVLPSSDASARAIGVASVGMGLFGTAITLGPFRRRERWAWLVSCYYPLFWLAHLAGDLPPGTDHIHQIVLAASSLAGLAVSLRQR